MKKIQRKMIRMNVYIPFVVVSTKFNVFSYFHPLMLLHIFYIISHTHFFAKKNWRTWSIINTLCMDADILDLHFFIAHLNDSMLFTMSHFTIYLCVRLSVYLCVWGKVYVVDIIFSLANKHHITMLYIGQY